MRELFSTYLPAILLDQDMTEDVKERFEKVAPPSFHYMDSSLDDDEVTQQIKSFYFNGSSPTQETMQRLTDVSLSYFLHLFKCV